MNEFEAIEIICQEKSVNASSLRVFRSEFKVNSTANQDKCGIILTSELDEFNASKLTYLQLVNF